MRHVSVAANGVRHELDLEPRELLGNGPQSRARRTITTPGSST